MAIVPILKSVIGQEGTSILRSVLAIPRQPHGRVSPPPELSSDDKPFIVKSFTKSQRVKPTASISGQRKVLFWSLLGFKIVAGLVRRVRGTGGLLGRSGCGVAEQTRSRLATR